MRMSSARTVDAQISERAFLGSSADFSDKNNSTRLYGISTIRRERNQLPSYHSKHRSFRLRSLRFAMSL